MERLNRLEEELKQPAQLPMKVRDQVREPILLYACLDLNEDLKLAEQWLVLTGSHLHWLRQENGVWTTQSIQHPEIVSIEEFSGLSIHRLQIDVNGGASWIVRYSHRQSKAVSLIRFALENKETLTEVKSPADELYQEQILSTLEENQSAASRKRSQVVRRLLSYLWPYRRQVAFGLMGATLMTLLGLVPAYLTGSLIDHVLKPFEEGRLSLDIAKQIAFWSIGGLAVTYIFREIFAWIRLKTMSIIGEKVARDLREQVYAHLHTLSMSFFSSKQTGSLISRVSSDTDRIWDFIAFGVVEVTTSLITLLGLTAVLLWLDWRLALLVTVPVPFLLYAIYRHGEEMENLFLRAWRRWSALTDCLSDTIPGIRVVKAFNRQNYETEKFKVRNDSALNEFTRIHETWTSFWPKLMLFVQALIVLVWIVGVPRVLHMTNGAPLSVGVFISFVLYLAMFVQPIEVIGQMARMVNRATSSAIRVFEVLDTKPQILEVKDPVPLYDLHGHIEFENVSFSYDGVRKVLNGVNFTIKPGEMIGLVGPSGGGKTTLTQLLARFYEPTQGTIRIDGVDLKQLDIGMYRQKLGMVLQEPYLFHGTLLENIRYAKPDATLDEVIEAARAANAHDFICRMPLAYDTVVGERGHTLSGGERQRVSIARAILSRPRILILDEATSAVDTETERKIQQALDRLVKGRTVIAIAHRLSTLAKADRIFVIKEGRLVEVGTHTELLKEDKGVYKNLVNMQHDLHAGFVH